MGKYLRPPRRGKGIDLVQLKHEGRINAIKEMNFTNQEIKEIIKPLKKISILDSKEKIYNAIEKTRKLADDFNLRVERM